MTHHDVHSFLDTIVITRLRSKYNCKWDKFCISKATLINCINKLCLEIPDITSTGSDETDAIRSGPRSSNSEPADEEYGYFDDVDNNKDIYRLKVRNILYQNGFH